MTKASLPSPIGTILIDIEGDRLRSLRILGDGEAQSGGDDDPANALASETARQIAAYFAKRLDRFDLPLIPNSSPRGQALREAILAIPAGETLSYGALARIAGSAPRAIGQACARNPFPLIVPCHRVIGSGGAIGHYSGANGITTKRWLLDHERRGGLI